MILLILINIIIVVLLIIVSSIIILLIIIYNDIMLININIVYWCIFITNIQYIISIYQSIDRLNDGLIWVGWAQAATDYLRPHSLDLLIHIW